MAASAWPLVAFITAPTTAPAACTLPLRIFSATSGCAARASSMAARRAPSSLTTASPRRAMTASTSPSPAITPSNTCRASLSFNEPSVMSASMRAMCWGVTPSASRSTSRSLAVRRSSPVHHLRAAAGSTPAATVSSTSSSAPALTTDARSKALICHSSCSRARLSLGSSGNVARSSSIHSRLGATGTRSGSGK